MGKIWPCTIILKENESQKRKLIIAEDIIENIWYVCGRNLTGKLNFYHKIHEKGLILKTILVKWKWKKMEIV